ncbi:MAG: radical SAM protein, partial [Candidatus Aminicenantes bacterium]|nr:radical SAM protein [Candidatus Aminicenantes bacterium]
IYCQLGHGSKTTISRQAFLPAKDILEEIKEKIRSGVRIDFITFSGSGEPTLNTEIGLLIREINKITDIPVAVLTNSTLLHRDDVRQALLPAALVVPSLDAVTQDVFEKVNRPHKSLKIKDIISGLKQFCREFKGKIWIEILLVKGVNDHEAHLQKLKEITSQIKPDKIQLNTVVRPPAEKFASALTLNEMERIRNFMGKNCEIIATFEKSSSSQLQKNQEESLLAMIHRRPMTLDDLSTSLGKPSKEVLKLIQFLQKEKKINSVTHKGKEYYEPKG